MVATVTIKISRDTKARIAQRRLYPREPFSTVIDRLLDDIEDTNPASLRRYSRIRRAAKRGKFVTHEEAKKRWGL